jgi:hypothetical protein
LPAAWLHFRADAVKVQFVYLIVGGYRQLLGRCNSDVQTFSPYANDELLFAALISRVGNPAC